MTSFLHYFNLVRYKAYVDLKTETAQSYLGFLWWLLEPLLYMGTFYLIFEVFMKRGGEGFIGFLLCGLVFWRWFDNSIKKMSASVIGNAGLVNQVHVPKIIFPLIDFCSNTFRFLCVFLIFMLFAVIYTGQVFTTFLAIPVLILIQGIFTIGLGSLLAAVVPLVPDLRKIIDNMLMLMFYMSGIFFDIMKVEKPYSDLLLWNPMAVLLHSYRQVILYGEPPDWMRLIVITFFGLVLFALSLILLIRYDKYYPRVLSR